VVVGLIMLIVLAGWRDVMVRWRIGGRRCHRRGIGRHRERGRV
jgi:hypothetical protein